MTLFHCCMGRKAPTMGKWGMAKRDLVALGAATDAPLSQRKRTASTVPVITRVTPITNRPLSYTAAPNLSYDNDDDEYDNLSISVSDSTEDVSFTMSECMDDITLEGFFSDVEDDKKDDNMDDANIIVNFAQSLVLRKKDCLLCHNSETDAVHVQSPLSRDCPKKVGSSN